MGVLTVAFLACLTATSAIQVDFSEQAWREKPIQKVIRLLNEMQEQLQKEADEDEDAMDKLGCWCATNEKEKTKAIADGNGRTADLQAAIEEYTAKSAQLKTDLETLNKEVAEKTESLESASKIREKESNEFYESEKEAIQNIGSLKGAVMTLGKVHNEFNQESLMQVKSILKRHMTAHRRMFEESLSRKQHGLVLSLLQEPMDADLESAFLQEEGKAGEGAPQSGAIFGILKQMKESFETNLASSQKEEETAKSEYSEMKSTKTQELNSAEELIDAKTVELAETDEKNAQSKQDLEDTSATIAADTEFLENLKSKCSNADAEYAARKKVRTEELQAVAETIGILTDDDAKDLLSKTFIQLSSRVTRVSNAERASRYLLQKGKELHRPRLSALAVSMRADVFAKVKENIDNMVQVLKKEQKDEVTQKDFCVKELHQTDMQTTEKTNLKEDLTQQIADFDANVATLKDEIKELTAQIKEMHTQMKGAAVNRVAENKEFQLTQTDQEATQKILAKALARLQQFYAKASLLQVRHFSSGKYKKHSGASSVVAMIEGIIDESKDVAAKALKAENEAQASYESFVKDSNAAIAAMNKDITNKSEQVGKADVTKTKMQGDLKHTEADLAKLAEYTQELHTQCDFLTKFFTIRQEKRAEEIEALQSAKAIFSGANFGF